MAQPTLIFKVPRCNLECTLTQHKNSRWKFCITNPHTHEHAEISRSFDTNVADAIVTELLHSPNDPLTTDFHKNVINLKSKVARRKIYSLKHPYANIRNRRQKGRIRPCRS